MEVHVRVWAWPHFKLRQLYLGEFFSRHSFNGCEPRATVEMMAAESAVPLPGKLDVTPQGNERERESFRADF